MSVARHKHVLVLVALFYEFVKETLHLVDNLHQFMAREKLQVDEHLIVA